jgi:hypothetical protein
MGLWLRYTCDVEYCGRDSGVENLEPRQLSHAWRYLTDDGWSYIDGQLRCPKHSEGTTEGGER